MRGTRRTIVTAAASLAVVLGVGGVAAATSGHGSHSDDGAGTTSSTSAVVASAHDQRGTESRDLKDATSTTVDPSSTTIPDDETSTTVEDATTSSTIEETSTTIAGTTSTTVEGDDDHDTVCDPDGTDHEARNRDDEGEAAEHAHLHGNTTAHLDKCLNGEIHRSDEGEAHGGGN